MKSDGKLTIETCDWFAKMELGIFRYLNTILDAQVQQVQLAAAYIDMLHEY